MAPNTIFRYIAGRMVFTAGALVVVLSSLIFLIDLIENFRFAGKYADSSLTFAMAITALRTPGLAQALAPFVFLFGAIWMFTQLNRRSEIAVLRSAGMSVWRFVGPAAFTAAAAGFVLVFVFDPLATRMLAAADAMKDSIRGRDASMVRVMGDGLWLRQRDANSTLLINADALDGDARALTGVTLWRLGPNSAFLERIDAPRALMRPGVIELQNARLKNASDRLDSTSPVYAVKTRLTPEDLQERVAPPQTISIWQLPHFARLADAAGLPTVRYHIRFHDLSSMPLKLVAMVLIAAIFSLRPWRIGGGFRLAMYSIGAGFTLYVMSEFFMALGESGAAPAAVSAWMPALVATLIAVASLLQIEDG